MDVRHDTGLYGARFHQSMFHSLFVVGLEMRKRTAPVLPKKGGSRARRWCEGTPAQFTCDIEQRIL